MNYFLTGTAAAILMISVHPAAAQSLPPAAPPAQDHIWQVPVPAAQDAMTQLVALQKALYDIVVEFDERARLFEKYVYDVEKMTMKEHAAMITAPGGPKSYVAPKKTFDEQVRFDAVAEEPTMCADLDARLDQFVRSHTAELDAVVTRLTAETAAMDDARKAEASEALNTALSAIGSKKRAQEIIAWCIYKKNNEAGLPCRYSVEKTLRTWFRIQKPLIDAWLGNTD